MQKEMLSNCNLILYIVLSLSVYGCDTYPIDGSFYSKKCHKLLIIKPEHTLVTSSTTQTVFKNGKLFWDSMYCMECENLEIKVKKNNRSSITTEFEIPISGERRKCQFERVQNYNWDDQVDSISISCFDTIITKNWKEYKLDNSGNMMDPNIELSLILNYKNTFYTRQRHHQKWVFTVRFKDGSKKQFDMADLGNNDGFIYKMQWELIKKSGVKGLK